MKSPHASRITKASPFAILYIIKKWSAVLSRRFRERSYHLRLIVFVSLSDRFVLFDGAIEATNPIDTFSAVVQASSALFSALSALLGTAVVAIPVKKIEAGSRQAETVRSGFALFRLVYPIKVVLLGFLLGLFLSLSCCFLLMVLHAPHRLLCQFLPKHALDHFLLPGHTISDGDANSCRSVDSDRTTQDGGRQCARPRFVVGQPRRQAQCELEAAVAIKQDDDGDKHTERERPVRFGLVRLVERVRLGKLALVILEVLLLFGRKDRVFLTFFVEGPGGFEVVLLLTSRNNWLGWEVVLIM